jgi:hypothetical protein
MSNNRATTNMNNLYAHLSTLMPHRRAKRGREDDATGGRVTKPKTLGVAVGESADCRTSGTTQTPSPNQKI